MLYPAALTSTLLSSATLALALDVTDPDTPAGARVELGELAEALLGAVAPAFTDGRETTAARLVAIAMNHLVGLGIATEDVSALILSSETRGARSRTNQAGADLVPPALQAQWDALAEPDPPAETANTFAGFAVVRGLR